MRGRFFPPSFRGDAQHRTRNPFHRLCGPMDSQLRDCAAEFSPAGCPGMTMGPSLRANGSRECAPDDRIREAIHRAACSGMDCFVAVAPRNDETSCPSGKSIKIRPALHVKIFRLTQRPNHCLTSARLTADEGRVAIVTNVAVGCDGREPRARTKRALADGEAVWS
jgi:hypothetical protein